MVPPARSNWFGTLEYSTCTCFVVFCAELRPLCPQKFKFVFDGDDASDIGNHLTAWFTAVLEAAGSSTLNNVK